jgi:outer membrane immunogenic protein
LATHKEIIEAIDWMCRDTAAWTLHHSRVPAVAPNWSVKTEALYYDLGSVTVTAPLTSSINPITAAIPATVNNTSTASVSSAINKFTGAATISNTAATRVTFQGVIIRLGLNYHFNLL